MLEPKENERLDLILDECIDKKNIEVMESILNNELLPETYAKHGLYLKKYEELKEYDDEKKA